MLVAAGTYYENIEIDKEIAVIGADRETTIIDGDSSGSVVYFGSNAGFDTYFSGFTIQNGIGNPSAEHDNRNSGGGILVSYPTAPLLTDLIVQNNTASGAGAGIFVEGNNTQLRLTNSIVRNNATSTEHGHVNGGGIELAGGGVGFIDNVEIYNNFATGRGGGINASGQLFITNSLIHNNTCGEQANGISGNSMYMYNCIVTQNGWQNNDSGYNGINSVNLEGTSTVQNSIIWGNYGDYNIGNTGGVMTVDYSIIEGGIAIGFEIPEEINWGSHNIISDPLFSDPENQNFTLFSGSPAIDAGNPSTFFNDSDGSQNDIGHTGGIGLVVGPLELDFGNVGIGNPGSENVVVANNRSDSLIIESVPSSDNQFYTSTGMPLTLLPFQRRYVDIRFDPVSTGEQSATLQLSFSNLSNNNGSFTAVGTAYTIPSGDIHVPADAPTIQTAIDIAPNNKTIVVAPGEYFENLIMKSHISLISSGGPAETIINGNNDEIGRRRVGKECRSRWSPYH